jgi:hypothetical protein
MKEIDPSMFFLPTKNTVDILNQSEENFHHKNLNHGYISLATNYRFSSN